MITKTKKLKKTLKNRRRNINNTFSSRKKSLINKKKRLSRRNKVLKGGETPKTTRVKEAPNTPRWGKVREEVVSKKVNVPAMQQVVKKLGYGSTPFSGPKFGIASSFASLGTPILSSRSGSNSILHGINPIDFKPKAVGTTVEAKAQDTPYTELFPTFIPKSRSSSSWVNAYQSEKLAEDKTQHELKMKKYVKGLGEYIELANINIRPESNVARRPAPAVAKRRPAPKVPTNVLPSKPNRGDYNFSQTNEKSFENKIKAMQIEMKAKEADTISGRAAELEQQMLEKKMQETEGLYQPLILPITAKATQTANTNTGTLRKDSISSPHNSPLTPQSGYSSVPGIIPNSDKTPYNLLAKSKASPLSSTGNYSSLNLVKPPVYDLGASSDSSIYSPTSQSTNANTRYRILSTSGRNAGQIQSSSESKLPESPYYSEITNKNPNEYAEIGNSQYAKIGNSPYAEVGPSPYAQVGPPTKKQQSLQNSANIEKARQRQEISNKIQSLTNNIDYSNERRQRLGITEEEEEKKINEKREQVKELVKKIKTLL